ncbi:MAG: transcriptional regulator NrdR [Clostridiales bacterium]|nr:transcriptional regulator NrdR [Clostridiales bacterium]
MKCPFCGGTESKVLDTRTVDEAAAIRRRRQCEKCGEKFTTYERVDIIPVVVIKNDNVRETFDRNKILSGIQRACNKRPVSMEQMENIVREIEASIYNTLGKEVYSRDIGRLVMDKLKDVDEVAYVRFASVYKQFKDIDSFMAELAGLLKTKDSGKA